MFYSQNDRKHTNPSVSAETLSAWAAIRPAITTRSSKEERGSADLYGNQSTQYEENKQSFHFNGIHSTDELLRDFSLFYLLLIQSNDKQHNYWLKSKAFCFHKLFWSLKIIYLMLRNKPKVKYSTTHLYYSIECQALNHFLR